MKSLKEHLIEEIRRRGNEVASVKDVLEWVLSLDVKSKHLVSGQDSERMGRNLLESIGFTLSTFHSNDWQEKADFSVVSYTPKPVPIYVHLTNRLNKVLSQIRTIEVKTYSFLNKVNGKEVFNMLQHLEESLLMVVQKKNFNDTHFYMMTGEEAVRRIISPDVKKLLKTGELPRIQNGFVFDWKGLIE